MPRSWRCANCAAACPNSQLQRCLRCATSRVAWCCKYCSTTNDNPRRTSCYWCRKERSTQKTSAAVTNERRGLMIIPPANCSSAASAKPSTVTTVASKPATNPGVKDVGTKIKISGLVDKAKLEESIGDFLCAHGCNVLNTVLPPSFDGSMIVNLADEKSVTRALTLHGTRDTARVDCTRRPHGRLPLRDAISITRLSKSAEKAESVKPAIPTAASPVPPATCKIVLPVHVPQGASCARFHALVHGDGNENLKYLQELPRCDIQYHMSTSQPDFIVKAQDQSALDAAMCQIKDLLHHVIELVKEEPLPSEHDDETTTAASTPRIARCHGDSWTGWKCWTCGLTVGESTKQITIQTLREAKDESEIGRLVAAAVVDYNRTAPEGWKVPEPLAKERR